jgi:glutamate/tyrosine decarboxylase-like PLP-dependent enzyme
LRRETRGLAAGSHWPCDYGPDLSRGFRALKTWFTLKTYGTDLLGAVMARTCALARYLEERVCADPRLELVAPAQLNIVCFRYRADDSNDINAQIAADLHESGIAVPSTTMINGRLTIRAAFVNHRTQPCDVDALVESVLRFGAANVAVHHCKTESVTTGSKTRKKLPSQYIPGNPQAPIEPVIAA